MHSPNISQLHACMWIFDLFGTRWINEWQIAVYLKFWMSISPH